MTTPGMTGMYMASLDGTVYMLALRFSVHYPAQMIQYRILRFLKHAPTRYDCLQRFHNLAGMTIHGAPDDKALLPIQVGWLDSCRIAMAPMTRFRADGFHIPLRQRLRCPADLCPGHLRGMAGGNGRRARKASYNYLRVAKQTSCSKVSGSPDHATPYPGRLTKPRPSIPRRLSRRSRVKGGKQSSSGLRMCILSSPD